MKKILLFVLALGVGYATIAQSAYKFKIDPRSQKAIVAPAIGIEPVKAPAIIKSQVEKQTVTPAGERGIDIVTVIDIGTSANAYSYGYAGGQKNIVHCEPGLNAVSNFHRQGGTLDPGGYSGDFGYDISTDGGVTWTNMLEVYTATDNGGGEYYYDAGRYPAHAIYNPTNNMDDAYIVFFAPNVDGSNSDGGTGWGGYSYGTGKISDTSVRTKHTQASQGDVYQYIPDAYDLTMAGMSICVDVNQDWTSGALVYESSLIVNQGHWNEETNDFDYEQFLYDFPIVNEADQGRPAFVKVAFGPDGMTGYICVLADNGEAEQIGGNLNIYPIIIKTTDGGETWGDPFAVQMDGPDGIGGIVYHLITDEQIAELFEAPVPTREEISYTTAFDCDIIVDKNNNLHIGMQIAPTGADPYSIVTAEGYLTAVDMFTTDGGTTWEIETLGKPRTFRGTFGDLTEDNRTQITTNADRDVIFVTWLDTDLEEEVDNNRPNLWCRGFDPFHPDGYRLTAGAGGADAPTNVTNFSAGMWQSYFGTVAQMALEPTPGTFVIPMTYEEMDPNDPAVPVQYKYITDFKFTDADFSLTGINERIKAESKIAEVSQNYPNPFNGKTYVTVNLAEGSDLSLNVYTITGQQVAAQNHGYNTAGAHTLTIDGSNLTPGVYFYTVTAGESKVTQKMIVE